MYVDYNLQHSNMLCLPVLWMTSFHIMGFMACHVYDTIAKTAALISTKFYSKKRQASVYNGLPSTVALLSNCHCSHLVTERNEMAINVGHIVSPTLGHYNLCLFMAGIQSDDAGMLRCLKCGSYDSLVELKLTVQGLPYCSSFLTL